MGSECSSQSDSNNFEVSLCKGKEFKARQGIANQYFLI